MTTPDTAGVRVELRGIVKRFGPVQVLHGVDLAFEPGRIVGLLGENGAGKSTLMKILAGYEAPSEGRIVVNGRAVVFDGPRAAEAEGIVLIHQEFNLAEDLTVAQNMFLGHEMRRGWFVDATPGGDEEFALRDGRLQAIDASLADERVDLLTVVAHELGHVLGLDDLDAGEELMAGALSPGVRRLPTDSILDDVFGADDDWR